MSSEDDQERSGGSEGSGDGGGEEAAAALESRLLATLERTWGYRSFLPLQREAMVSHLHRHDSVVILPTGGGKSLCYQAPALLMDGTALVVSPLISLMKDQVDSLCASGVPAAFINSSMEPDEKRSVFGRLRRGEVRLLYLSPERLVQEGMLAFLKELPISSITIDEAHCISEWGHDFRPEYRELKVLKEAFPGRGVHGYTATATERVRMDIARALNLEDPSILVGPFDRPNLTYRCVRRADRNDQILSVVRRHPGESGIVYMISRADVERVHLSLSKAGITSLPYHAGLDDSVRRRNQESFLKDRVQVMVATVAFGMGIHKSDVRFVIHGGLPKALEAYQQEAGRAGRDGLPAECWLFYSGSDYAVWKKMLEGTQSAEAAGALKCLSQMYEYASGLKCRHRALVGHFGQELGTRDCGACDFCLNEVELISDGVTAARKILSCVVRTGQSFGGSYVTQVLLGSDEARIRERGHHSLSTYGLLSGENKATVRRWVEELVDQGFLERYGEYDVLRLTATGVELLKGQGEPRLSVPIREKVKKGSGSITMLEQSWEGVDRGLFEELRRFRREKAEEMAVPPYVIFPDSTLRELARVRPSSRRVLAGIKGVGEAKLEKFGHAVLTTLERYASEHGLSMDVTSPDTLFLRRPARNRIAD